MKIYENMEALVGKTPLVHLKSFEKENNLKVTLLAKLEAMNPAGSTKTRVALEMIRDAEERGLLREGSVIIEPTSGNTGIGLAAVAVRRGYRVILTMPDSMSHERQTLLKAYGAELILTPGAEGMDGAIRKAESLQKEIEGSFIPGQFTNPANAKAHYKSTGPEIWEDTDGKVDIFVAGVGTGGTITGVGTYLKEQKEEVQIIGVEPYSSPVLSSGEKGAHGLQGIGAGFIPEVLNTAILDDVLTITEEEAYLAARQLSKTEGYLVGISSGAALSAAVTLAKREENHGKTIVVLLPDTGDRYLSTPLFSE